MFDFFKPEKDKAVIVRTDIDKVDVSEDIDSVGKANNAVSGIIEDSFNEHDGRETTAIEKLNDNSPWWHEVGYIVLPKSEL